MVEFPVHKELRVHVAESNSTGSAGSSSLEENLVYVGEQRLADLTKPGMRVVIAFTDATRACPDRQLVNFLIRELLALGLEPAQITLLVATGLHRPMTEAERLDKLGPDVEPGVQFANHRPLEPAELVDLGEIEGVPVVINRRCVEADLVLATGVVEPHQYAGYSGGFKTVVIGCGGEATIRVTHGVAMLDRHGTRLGAIGSNPFQAFVRQAGRRIGVDYVVNVVLDEAGQIVAAAAGEPAAVHDFLVAQARTIYEVTVPRPAHLVLAGVDGPKAVNLYQASRAATYLALTDRTPLLPGAPILLPAPIPEGAGAGTGEQRFYDILRRAESPAGLVEALRRTGFPAGAQRAYILAQVLVEHPVIVVGAKFPEIVRDCHMYTAPDMVSGLALAEELARRHFNRPAPEPLDFLVVPHALLTLPRLSESGKSNR